MRDQLSPESCAEKLVVLSTYYANLNKHIADLQDKFYRFHAMTMDLNPEMSAAKLKVIVQASDEYRRKNEAERLEKSLIEVIRSLKRYVRIKEGEWESSKNL